MDETVYKFKCVCADLHPCDSQMVLLSLYDDMSRGCVSRHTLWLVLHLEVFDLMMQPIQQAACVLYVGSQTGGGNEPRNQLTF